MQGKEQPLIARSMVLNMRKPLTGCVRAPLQGEEHAPQGPAAQRVRPQDAGAQERCRKGAACAPVSQAPGDAAPAPAGVQKAVRFAVPSPPQAALQALQGLYSHCAPAHAAVLRARAHACIAVSNGSPVGFRTALPVMRISLHACQR